MKKKICLVCDVPNWAFDNIAKIVKSKLSHKYDIVIDYFDESVESDFFFEFLEKYVNYDLIHFFWRKTLLLFESSVFIEKATYKYNLEEYMNKLVRKISTGAYDFLGINEKWLASYGRVFNNYCNHYSVSSKKLYDAYSKIKQYKKPTMVVHDTCNWDNFKPINIERFSDTEKQELVLGWVGKSGRIVDGIDLKGYDVIIKPTVQELKDAGYLIRGHYANSKEKSRTQQEMPTYYSEIDVCLCTSIHEGTPLPILEAMACGVPVITTDVGIVQEALGPKQKEFIIGNRDNGENDVSIKQILKEKIIQIYNNRNILKELSNENLDSIVKYDNGKIIQEFDEYFSKCLED